MAKQDTAEQSPEAQKAAKEAGLVRMFKDGQTTYVHPTCVKAHEHAFWKVVAG